MGAQYRVGALAVQGSLAGPAAEPPEAPPKSIKQAVGLAPANVKKPQVGLITDSFESPGRLSTIPVDNYVDESPAQ